MKNSATVFSDKGAVITPARFAIVRPPPGNVELPVPENSDNPLRDYLLEVMENDALSYKDIERNAREKGGSLGRSTIQQIVKGETTNPGIFTLLELSWGINRPIERLILVALGSYIQDPTLFQKSELAGIQEMISSLSTADQKFAKRLIQVLDREVRRMLGGK